jgi:hypothetical protein
VQIDIKLESLLLVEQHQALFHVVDVSFESSRLFHVETLLFCNFQFITLPHEFIPTRVLTKHPGPRFHSVPIPHKVNG